MARLCLCNYLAPLFGIPDGLQVGFVALLPLGKLFDALLSCDQSFSGAVDSFFNDLGCYFARHSLLLCIERSELGPHTCYVLELLLEVHDKAFVTLVDLLGPDFSVVPVVLYFLHVLPDLSHVLLWANRVIRSILDHYPELV